MDSKKKKKKKWPPTNAHARGSLRTELPHSAQTQVILPPYCEYILTINILRTIYTHETTMSYALRIRSGSRGMERGGIHSPKVNDVSVDGLKLNNSFSSLEVTDHEDMPASSQTIATQVLDESDDELTHEIEDIKQGLQKLDSVQTDQISSIEFTQAQIDEIREENRSLHQQLADIELEVQRNKYALNTLGNRQREVETLARKKNLVIEGLSEKPRGHEDTHATVVDLFKAMDIDGPVNYDQAYRIGPFNEKRTRALFISFVKMEDRNFIFSQRTNLRKSVNHYNVWINDDVTPEARRTRNVIRQVTSGAKEAGARCTSTQQAVIIDNRRYDLMNLDLLPDDLSLEKIKTKQVNDADIAYHSEHSPFSNLYPCTIFIRTKEFHSVEQVVQYKKAKLFNNERVVNKIYLSRDVYEIRQLGKELGSSKEWDAKVENVMFAAMIKKFGNDEQLLAKLLATGDKRLIEATPDTRWGAGASISSKAITSGQWKGKNKQGELLMQARKKLRLEKAPTPKQTSADLTCPLATNLANTN